MGFLFVNIYPYLCKMKITEEIKQVFSDCEIHQAEWQGTGPAGPAGSITYKVEIRIPNKWSAFINLGEKDSQFTNYHGPCDHLSLKEFNVHSVDDLKTIRNVVEKYLKVMQNVEDLKNIAKNIKHNNRNTKIESLLDG